MEAAKDDAVLAQAIPALAREALAHNPKDTLSLQLAAGAYDAAVETLDDRSTSPQNATNPNATTPIVANANAAKPHVALELYARAKVREKSEHLAPQAAFESTFRDHFAHLDDRQAYDAAWSLGTLPRFVERPLREALAQHPGPSLSLPDAEEIIRAYVTFQAYQHFAPWIATLSVEDESRRYIIHEDLLINTPHGATLSAIIVRPKNAAKLPTALIAAMEVVPYRARNYALFAASRGYIGISSDTHGKRLSPDPVVLFDHDSRDLYGVIDWISKQPWSDGQVGMYGGSNSGFEQWAAAKSMHPALKTIVPYCPLNPGYGLPMYNNIFITANYDSHLQMGGAKLLDERFMAPGRMGPIIQKWYESGRPYRELDQIDGHPNPWLQKFLQHPAYDAYWQSLLPYGKDFARIKIPILAIDGYYDDGHNYAVYNLHQHLKHYPQAEHYLVIGPYDHFGAQDAFKAPNLRGYAIDPVAQLNTPALTFEWFDHVMRGGPKPPQLKDRINYQVMGANEWRHAPSLEAMSNKTLKFYLTDAKSGEYYRMTTVRPSKRTALRQTVDFKDRTKVSAPSYPSSILSSTLDTGTGFAFVSEPFDAPLSVSGMFSANLRAKINKRDMDIAMVLYEVTPSGEFFHLSYTIERASFARDMTRRQILTPGKVESIPLERTLLVSRQLRIGSRLLVVLDVNRGPAAQVNYGTGKDVSDESIADAAEPLQIEWRNDSVVKVPVWQ